MRRILIPAIVILVAREAYGCGVCALAAIDWVLPPAQLWIFLPLSWFVASAVATRFSGVPFGPSLPAASVWAVVALFVAAALIGPLATIPLGMTAAVVWLRTALSSTHRRKSAVVVVGVVHLIAVTAGVGYGLRARQTRSVGEYVCKWPASAPARAKFAQLAATGAQAAPSYRYIVRNARDEHLTIAAAEGLARAGESADIQLLESVRSRIRDAEDRQRVTLAITHLRRRTGN